MGELKQHNHCRPLRAGVNLKWQPVIWEASED